MTRIADTDRQVLNDFDKASNEAKEFHRMKAQGEVAGIVQRHRKSPGYLKLLSTVLAEAVEPLYQKHLADLKDTPEARQKEQYRQEFMEELRQKKTEDLFSE